MGERGVTFRTCVADDSKVFVVHFDHAAAGEEPEHAGADGGSVSEIYNNGPTVRAAVEDALLASELAGALQAHGVRCYMDNYSASP